MMNKPDYKLETIETPIECLDCKFRFVLYNEQEICTCKRMDKKIKFMSKCPLGKW